MYTSLYAAIFDVSIYSSMCIPAYRRPEKLIDIYYTYYWLHAPWQYPMDDGKKQFISSNCTLLTHHMPYYTILPILLRYILVI